MKSPNVRWNIAGPAIIGAVALVVAGYLAWLTFQHDDEGGNRTTTPAAQGKPAKAVRVDTHTVLNRAGGYSLKVPRGMTATRKGVVTRIRDTDRTIAVTVAPIRKGKPADNNKDVLRSMLSTYRTVSLTTSQRQRIDKRAAVASYGKAVTKKGVSLRFVLLAVKGGERNFAISTFTAADSDPNKVLPRVRAISNGFHVLSAKQAARK